MKTVRRKALPESPELVVHEIVADAPGGTIAIPVRDHLNAATVQSLVYAAFALPKALPQAVIVDMSIIQGSVLTLQRNEAVHLFRGDWLMFIDDDMVFTPHDILQLLEDMDEHDLDIVGGLCFRRTEPHQPTLYMRESPTAGRYSFLERWDSDLVEVDATGMAFVVIRKRVFEKIAAAHGETFPSFEERQATDPPEYFRWYGRIGEDLRFCQDAKDAGCRIFVDTRVKIGHVGEINIGHRQFLEQLAMRPQDVVDARRIANSQMELPTVTREEARHELGWDRA